MRIQVLSYELANDTYQVMLHETPWGDDYQLWLGLDAESYTLYNHAEYIDGASDYPLEDEQWAWVQSHSVAIVHAISQWFDDNIA